MIGKTESTNKVLSNHAKAFGYLIVLIGILNAYYQLLSVCDYFYGTAGLLTVSAVSGLAMLYYVIYGTIKRAHRSE